MKKCILPLICAVLALSLVACNSEPDNALWQQYKNAEDPSVLFTDIGVDETVLLDDSGYIVTLQEASPVELKSDRKSGFVFDVTLQKNSTVDVIFKFTEIAVNGITIPMKYHGYTATAHSILGNNQHPGTIILEYEDLAKYGISTVENVSCVLEVYELIIVDQQKVEEEDGSTYNETYCESGDLLYTSDIITFETY